MLVIMKIMNVSMSCIFGESNKDEYIIAVNK